MTLKSKKIGPFYFYKTWNVYFGGKGSMKYGVEITLFGSKTNLGHSRPFPG